MLRLFIKLRQGEKMELNPYEVGWEFDLKGHAWTNSRERYNLIPEIKFEMIDGKLFWDDETRLMVIGLLLENVGLQKVVRLGKEAAWREAVAKL
jgi:hypothetical protein